ncbi:MAG: energy transducer TonB [Gammaproteobacteria bacterium]|nr:energy transducer TonB [Gammaproteobacteria bacterium]
MGDEAELLRKGLPPAQDRLLTTVFLAALLHAILILGITFRPSRDASGRASGLEVILVDDRAPAVAANPHAAYLSERSQLGAGNTLADARALIPKSSPAAVNHPGVEDGRALDYRRQGSLSGDGAVLTTTGQATRVRYLTGAAAASSAAQLPIRLENRADFAMESNDDGVELRLRGQSRRQLWIAADTRAVDVAEYLDRWRRRVERIGTRNFPTAARDAGGTATPVIAVTIDADGRLAHMRILHSSGRPDIDDAAIRILTLSAPFAPFPRQLAAKHDQIRIAYQWEFLAGEVHGSHVYYAPPGSAPATAPGSGAAPQP